MKLRVIVVVQSFVIVGLIVLIGWIVYSLMPETQQASLEVKDGQIVTESPDGNSSDRICMEVGGEQIWLPVLEGVPVCKRSADAYQHRNGQVFYLEDQQITSSLGVDVSEFQGEIDWETVRESGIDFAIIRCGFRGYGSGELHTDNAFDQNMQNAAAAGLKLGVYFYSQAITVEEAVEEAELTLDLIQNYELTYPVVFDWEVVSSDTARTDTITPEMLTDCTVAFCETIKAAGYTPMVYGNKRTSLLKFDLAALRNYDFWLAEYSQTATFYYDYRIWQYCSDGQVPGIPGEVDMNICFAPYGA